MVEMEPANDGLAIRRPRVGACGISVQRCVPGEQGPSTVFSSCMVISRCVLCGVHYVQLCPVTVSLSPTPRQWQWPVPTAQSGESPPAPRSGKPEVDCRVLRTELPSASREFRAGARPESGMPDTKNEKTPAASGLHISDCTAPATGCPPPRTRACPGRGSS